MKSKDYTLANRFLKTYVINSFIVLVIKLIFCIVEEGIISDTLISTVTSLAFASIYHIRSFLFISIDGVGPLALLLIFHFTIYFTSLIIDNLSKKKMPALYSILLLVIGVALYALLKIVLDVALPLSLLEAICLSMVISPVALLLCKVRFSRKVINIISIVVLSLISLMSYVYLFYGYFE